jgi:hypothetical protein
MESVMLCGTRAIRVMPPCFYAVMCMYLYT